MIFKFANQSLSSIHWQKYKVIPEWWRDRNVNALLFLEAEESHSCFRKNYTAYYMWPMLLQCIVASPAVIQLLQVQNWSEPRWTTRIPMCIYSWNLALSCVATTNQMNSLRLNKPSRIGKSCPMFDWCVPSCIRQLQPYHIQQCHTIGSLIFSDYCMW